MLVRQPTPKCLHLPSTPAPSQSSRAAETGVLVLVSLAPSPGPGTEEQLKPHLWNEPQEEGGPCSRARMHEPSSSLPLCGLGHPLADKARCCADHCAMGSPLPPALRAPPIAPRPTRTQRGALLKLVVKVEGQHHQVRQHVVHRRVGLQEEWEPVSGCGADRPISPLGPSSV